MLFKKRQKAQILHYFHNGTTADPLKGYMRRLIILVFALVFSGCVGLSSREKEKTPSPLPPGKSGVPEEFLQRLTLQPGDILDVVVRRGAGEERFAVTVRENGTVSFLTVDVGVKDLTISQAEEKIREELSRLIINPKVHLIITQRTAGIKKVFIFGEVKSPGVYPLTEGFTLLKALAVAGGYTETAVLESTRVIRGDLAHQPEILSIDIEKLFHQGETWRDLVLQDNDIIFVPRERVGDWNAFLGKIRPTVEMVVLPLQAILLGIAVFP